MRGSAVRIRARLLLVVGLSMFVVALVPALAQAIVTPTWQSGPLVEVQDQNCITGDIEYEAGSYLSYYANPASPPQTGQVYYVAIDVAGIGNTCTGAYGDIELSMPAGTAPAISAQNPVRCYLQYRGSTSYTNVAGNCPQNLQVGPHGYYLDPTNNNPPFWPVVQGDAVEVQVPVISTVPLNGTSQFHGFVELADGQTDPIMTPSLLAIVNQSGSQNVGGTNKQIGILYVNPPITSETTNGNSTVNANFTSYVVNNSNPGTAYAELAKADAAGDCTSPVLFTPTITSNSASLQNPQTQITGAWTSLYPGGAYCFRLVATVTSGASAGTYYGNWVYFATQGSFLSNAGTSQYVPPPSHPLTGTNCATNGAGCPTSNCTTGASCNQTGSVSSAGHNLTISRGGTGSGSVSDGGPIKCPSACSATYLANAQTKSVTLTATPAAGSTFAGWSGACSGTGTCQLTMGSDQSVTATFTLIAKPPPPKPTPPSCSVSAASSHVLLHAHKRSQRSQVGLLGFHVRCNQNANVTLAAVLTETLGKKHGKLVTRTLRLGPARGSVRAGVTSTLSLKLSGGELSALGRHLREALAVSLAGTNVNGTGRASTSIGRLRGTG